MDKKLTLDDISIGDKVVLRSGGPEMEVIGISRNGRVWVDWKIDDSEYGVRVEETSFMPEQLTHNLSIVKS